jgi:4-alpha-glucanotransferase
VSQAGLLAAARERLGLRHLLLGIHDAAFPAGGRHDLGRGAPGGAGGTAVLAFAARLGFTGLQLGPQGRASPGNPSPYDGTLFSRDPSALDLDDLVARGWLDGAALERQARAGAHERADFAHAHEAAAAWLAEAEAGFRDRGDLAAKRRLQAFRRRHREWLQRDGLHAALARRHPGPWTTWPERERSAWLRGNEAALQRLLNRHRADLSREAFAQWLAHEQHARFRERARVAGLALFGDLQIGFSQADVWSRRELLLETYVMGAPPSRTNPEGQPWNYPLLDPRQYGERGEGPALRFFGSRLAKAFDEFDGLRIDHPHGLVCPWVYRADAPDPARAVGRGARLFESPDHPDLAGFAIVRRGQIDAAQEPHADGRVVDLDDAQVARFAVLFDAIVAAAQAHGRTTDDLACEVLSTEPYPLRRVRERHGLGRFRVTQKVGLADPLDVYRSENARPNDWLMPGSHDTPTLWQRCEEWVATGLAADHAHYLAERLALPDAGRTAFVAQLAQDPSALAHAKLAELFVGPARRVMLYFTDLFGFREPYNRPGTVRPDNWSLRLAPDFERRYERDREAGRALDLGAGLALALEARARRGEGGEEALALAAALRRG